MIFHELESEWALEIVRGVERVAGQHHLAVVLSEMQGRRTPGRGWIEGVLARRPTGVIAVFSDLSESMRAQLATRGIPYVVVDPTGEPLHDTPSVGATNWNGGLTATRHLLSLGHRRIGGDRRARSGSSAAAPGSTAIGRRWTRPACRSARTSSATASSTSRRASTAAGRCSRLKDRPTAIFAGNDLQALGVYQAAREARLHIPEDLSVVGFDDLPVAQWVGPPMTTVRQPLVDMATAAAEMVVAMRAARRRRRPGSSWPRSWSSARAPRRPPPDGPGRAPGSRARHPRRTIGPMTMSTTRSSAPAAPRSPPRSDGSG